MENIDMRRLARDLKLSVSTVSKALRDSYEISAETKRKVLALAHELNYVPNPYASSLRRKKSKTIAVVLPEVTDSFFALALNGIESVAQSKGYHVLIYLTHETAPKERAVLQDCQSGRVDGVLVSLSRETTDLDHFEALYRKGIPTVFFDRVPEEAPTARIRTNDVESGYLATRHLIERDCRQIAFLSISSGLAIANRRLEGYQRALADAGLPIRPELIVNGSGEAGHNEEVVRELLQRTFHPDGVVASVEALAIATYCVCGELGYAIPGRVKVISFSNLETASLLNPSLSTITQPAFEMGKVAATVLFKALRKPAFDARAESVVLPSRLFARDSTGPGPPLADAVPGKGSNRNPD